MTQYIVQTKDGKIVSSKPSLPISEETLQHLNDSASNGLYLALRDTIPSLVHCEVIGINWEQDIVDHILIQV